VAVAQPVTGEGVGELVEVDGVPQVASDCQTPAGQVEVGEVEVAGLAPAEAVDGDERDDEFGHRGVGPVDQAAEPVGGDRRGQALDMRQRDAVHWVAEDHSFLFECLEQGSCPSRRRGLPAPRLL